MAQKFRYDWNALKEKLDEEEKSKSKKFEKDERFWAPAKEDDNNKKSKVGTYQLRIVPDKDGNPFVKTWNHNFEYVKDGKKLFWSRNCINTFGYEEDCPICKKNMELWNSSFQSDKDVASKQKRKLQYVANILIIKDPHNPENDNKVFLWKFGKKIYDKIKRHMSPSDEDRQDPDFVEFFPFDVYEGANFKLKVKMQGDYPNYDDSEFSVISPLCAGDDKKISSVLAKTRPLSEFLDRAIYPTNEETLKALSKVLGVSMAAEDADADVSNDISAEKPAPKKSAPPAKAKEMVAEPEDDDAASTVEDDDDKFFKELQ